MKAILTLFLTAALLHAEAYDASVPEPTHSEVKYGPHARNVLDFWQAKADRPTPLVLVIHGGGWTSGSKERVHRFVDVRALLDTIMNARPISPPSSLRRGFDRQAGPTQWLFQGLPAGSKILPVRQETPRQKAIS